MTPIDPDPLDALIKRGQALEAARDPEGALALYDEAARLAPEQSRPLLNRGNALTALGRYAEAEATLQQAYALGATASAQLNLGNLYLRTGRLPEATTAYAEALRLRPGWAAAGFGELCVLHAARDPKLLQAIDDFLAAHPQHSGASAMRLSILSTAPPEQILECVDPTRCTDPKLLLLRSSAAAVLFDHDSAMADRRRAVELDPADMESLCSLAFASMTHPSAEGSRSLLPLIRRALPPTEVATPPLRDAPPYRIGYLSGDYYAHPSSNFLIPLFLGHRRERFLPIALANLSESDKITEIFKSLSPEWIDLGGLDDEAAEARLRKARLDVIVDLSGWTLRNRLRVLARRIAPVQLTAIGAFLTTGVPTIDFRVCNTVSDPPGLTEDQYSETLLRMDGPPACYHEMRTIVFSPIQPARINGYFTFGFFNHPKKITREMVDQWTAILAQAPAARLKIIGLQHDASHQWLLNQFDKSGVAERVELHGRLRIENYDATLTTVDLALDSYPYNGGTTTLETLLAGVPVLTRRGPWSVSRSTLVALEPLGLSDWAVDSAEEFIARAVAIANGPVEPLETLRAQLPQRVRRSSLMDRVGYIERWEAALLDAIQRRRAAMSS